YHTVQKHTETPQPMPNLSREVVSLKLLFFGSDRFSLVTLERLSNLGSWLHVDVMTKPNTAVEKWARENRNIGINYWTSHDNLISSCAEAKHDEVRVTANTCNYHDIGMVVSFGHMIDESTINSFSKGIFNVHPSLLPRWRGSSPIQKAILAGDTHTGVSLMRVMPHKFDVGDVILQHKVPIGPRETALELYDRLAILGANLSENFLTDIDGHLKNAWRQDTKKSMKTYAKKLIPEDGLLDLSQNDCWHIDRRYRAYFGFVDIYIPWLHESKMRVYDMQDPQETQSMMTDLALYKPISTYILGDQEIFFHKRRRLLCFSCAGRTWVAFGSVAPPGRRRMSALEFYNGFLREQVVDKIPKLKTDNDCKADQRIEGPVPHRYYSKVSHHTKQNGVSKTASSGPPEPHRNYRINNQFWHHFFRLASSLANETFSIILFANLFWNCNNTIARQLVLCWFIVMFPGQFLKDLLKMPRARSSSVAVLEPSYSNEYGMPSTHAMAGACLPVTMTYLFNKNIGVSLKLTAPISLLWCLSVIVSRIYLGMHSLFDLIGGLFITFLIMCPLLPSLAKIDHFMLHCTYWPVIALIIMITFSVVYPEPKPKSPTRGDSCSILGAFTGMTIGNWVNFNFGLIPLTDSVFAIGQRSIHFTAALMLSSLLRFCFGLLLVLTVKTLASRVSLLALAKLNGLDHREESIQNLKRVEIPYRLITYMLSVSWSHFNNFDFFRKIIPSQEAHDSPKQAHNFRKLAQKGSYDTLAEYLAYALNRQLVDEEIGYCLITILQRYGSPSASSGSE
ncbi:Sphingosine-1-phosphate phosphatase 2, partial [Fragariocoptes setiger]